MKKILMFFITTAFVFGFAGVTGATQFTLSDINNLNLDISVDLAAFVGDHVWTPKWDPKPHKFLKFSKFKKKHKNKKHRPASVPEPSTMLLLGFGLVGLAVVGRKRFK